MTHYIPSSDAKFDPWLKNLVHVISGKPNEFQLPKQEIKELQEHASEWNEGYSDAVAKRDEMKAATEAKDEARNSTEALVRSVVRRIQADDRISNAARLDAGLPLSLIHI